MRDGRLLIKSVLDLTRRKGKLSKWKSGRRDWRGAHLASCAVSPGGGQPERAGDCYSSTLKEQVVKEVEEEEEEEAEVFSGKRRPSHRQATRERRAVRLWPVFSSFTLELVNSSGERARATQLERGSFRRPDPFFFFYFFFPP